MLGEAESYVHKKGIFQLPSKDFQDKKKITIMTELGVNEATGVREMVATPLIISNKDGNEWRKSIIRD